MSSVLSSRLNLLISRTPYPRRLLFVSHSKLSVMGLVPRKPSQKSRNLCTAVGHMAGSTTPHAASQPSAGRVVRVRFHVDVDKVAPNECVYVTGSIDALGKWEPQQALLLEQDLERPSRFVGFVDTTEPEVRFRYFIAYKLSADVADRLIVSQWEAFLHPRCCSVVSEERDGECRRQSVDLFGYYGLLESYDSNGTLVRNEFKAGRRLVSEGWLQYDDENQILLRVHGNALKFFKHDRKNCTIKCTPMDVRRKIVAPLPPSSAEEEMDEDEDTSVACNSYPSHSDTVVSILSNDRSKFNTQPDTGVPFANGKDYVVFKTHSVAVEFLAFLLEVFSDEGKRIGACYALPTSLNDTFGRVGMPLINSHGRPIGQINVEYLFVRNLRKQHPRQTMEFSYSRHWKKRNTLEVGHRGAGNSYTKFAQIRENTVHSLNIAAKNGADYVEFDVQLTKDKIAVIYHDFHVLVSVSRRTTSSTDLNQLPESDRKGIDYHEMALKELKLSQLRLLMLDHLKHKEVANAKKLVGDEAENDDLRPFPRLADALKRVDPDVGFNVEVKYPMMQRDGLHECDNYFERNEFVDNVLGDILNYAGNRRIMFSSFDPDICSLLAMKQNKYPCLFLCVGDTQRYTPFQDQRSSTSMTAVNFAAGIDILGVNFNSEDLLKDPRPVKRASELGLVTFVWGDDLDKREICNYFKRELGVDGIIYDRIGEEERRRNVFIVEREQKKALFRGSSGASTPRTRSPDAGTGSKPSSDQGSTPGTPPIDVITRTLDPVPEIPQPSKPATSTTPRIDIQQS